MSVGHAHSHRPRRRRFNRAERDIAVVALGRDGRQRALARAQRRLARIERRRQRLAEGPREVIVQVPGLSGRPVAGQRQGRFVVGGGPSRFVFEALIRQIAEAARG